MQHGTIESCYATLADVTDRFVGLVSTLPADRAAVPIAGLTWTVGECAAHVLSVYGRMTDDFRRARDPADVARLNEVGIREIGVDLVSIGGEIAERHRQVQRLATRVEPEQRFPFHAGQQVTYAQGAAIVCGELAVHGDDISRAVGISWPITSEDLEPVWRLALPALQGWLRRGAMTLHEVWVLRMAAWARPVVVELDRGCVRVRDEEPLADDRCPTHVVAIADPVTFTLGFPYGRRRIDHPDALRLAGLFEPV